MSCSNFLAFSIWNIVQAPCVVEITVLFIRMLENLISSILLYIIDVHSMLQWLKDLITNYELLPLSLIRPSPLQHASSLILICYIIVFSLSLEHVGDSFRLKIYNNIILICTCKQILQIIKCNIDIWYFTKFAWVGYLSISAMRS